MQAEEVPSDGREVEKHRIFGHHNEACQRTEGDHPAQCQNRPLCRATEWWLIHSMTLDQIPVTVRLWHESFLCSGSLSWSQEEQYPQREALDAGLIAPRPPDRIPLGDVGRGAEDQSEEEEVGVFAGTGVRDRVSLGHILPGVAQVQFPRFLSYVNNRAVNVDPRCGLQEVLLDKVGAEQQGMEEKHVEKEEAPLVGAQLAQEALEAGHKKTNMRIPPSDFSDRIRSWQSKHLYLHDTWMDNRVWTDGGSL